MATDEHGTDERTDLEKDNEAWNLPMPLVSVLLPIEGGGLRRAGVDDAHVRQEEQASS